MLSCSRKAYSEAVWRQDTESFIRCLENAFGDTANQTGDASSQRQDRAGVKYIQNNAVKGRRFESLDAQYPSLGS